MKVRVYHYNNYGNEVFEEYDNAAYFAVEGPDYTLIVKGSVEDSTLLETIALYPKNQFTRAVLV